MWEAAGCLYMQAAQLQATAALPSDLKLALRPLAAAPWPVVTHSPELARNPVNCSDARCDCLLVHILCRQQADQHPSTN